MFNKLCWQFAFLWKICPHWEEQAADLLCTQEGRLPWGSAATVNAKQSLARGPQNCRKRPLCSEKMSDHSKLCLCKIVAFKAEVWIKCCEPLLIQPFEVQLALAQVAQRGDRCPILGNIKGQIEPGDVPAQGETRWPWTVPFKPKYAMIYTAKQLHPTKWPWMGFLGPEQRWPEEICQGKWQMFVDKKQWRSNIFHINNKGLLLGAFTWADQWRLQMLWIKQYIYCSKCQEFRQRARFNKNEIEAVVWLNHSFGFLDNIIKC